MPTRAIKALAVALLCSATGCYQHHVLAFGGNAGTVNKFHRTIHTGFWGAKAKPIVPPQGTAGSGACAANGLFDVTVKSNLLFELVTVTSVGLYSPRTVEWNCAAPIPRVGPSLGGPASPAGPGTNQPSSTRAEFTSRTAYSLGWGLVENDVRSPANFSSPPPLPITPINCVPDNLHPYGMRQVRFPLFPRNYFFSLVTVGTAGFYSPVHVQWSCVRANHVSALMGGGANAR